MRIIVETEELCTHSYHSGEQFGHWQESYNFNIINVFVATEDDPTPYGSEAYRIKDDSTHAHVIYMTYDTGDSFGRATGKGVILGVWGDRKRAEETLKAIEYNKDSFTINVKDDHGREISLFNPGAGYFEHINDITLHSYPVSADTRTIKVKF